MKGAFLLLLLLQAPLISPGAAAPAYSWGPAWARGGDARARLGAGDASLPRTCLVLRGGKVLF